MLWLGAIAGAAIATLPGAAGIGCAIFGAIVGGILGGRSSFRSVRPPILLLAFFVPVFTMAVAPGEDMAMHVALARGLLLHNGDLSPAWPGVQALLYPRGFSALVALLSPVGLARAGLLACGISYAVFWCGLSRTLHAMHVPHSRLVALVAVFLSRTPQHFFDWGGNPTTLALGLALLNRPLFLAGALAVHPMGALAGALPGVLIERRVSFTFVALFVLIALLGPRLSPRELDFLSDYARNHEELRFRSLGAEVGDAATVLTLIAALIARRRFWKPLLGVVALAITFQVLPLANLYPVRFAPLLLLCIAPLWAQLGRVPLYLALMVAIPFHLRWYQRAKPLATHADLQAMQSIEATVPKDAVIDAAYASAGQWIPALTGRAITHAHQHVSLFDEIDAHPLPKATWSFENGKLRKL
jgi:hypothetical protein